MGHRQVRLNLISLIVSSHYNILLHIRASIHNTNVSRVDRQTDYKSATTIPATPRTPGSAVCMAPAAEDALLAAELAEEATLLAEERAAELLLLAAELPLLDSLEAALEAEEEAAEEAEEADEEAEEEAELPPVMLLRTEPGWSLGDGRLIDLVALGVLTRGAGDGRDETTASGGVLGGNERAGGEDGNV